MIKKITVLFCFAASVCLADTGQYRSDVVIARNYGAKTYSTLTNVLKRCGAERKTVLLDGGVWNITNAVVFPTNVALDVARGSYISGDDKIAGLRYAEPEWWGAVVNDTNCDASAIENALYAAEVVQLSQGEYVVKRTAAFESGNGHDVELRGIGSLITRHGDLSSEFTVGVAGGQSYIMSGNNVPYSFTIDGVAFDAGFNSAQSIGWTNVSQGVFKINANGLRVRNCKFMNFGPAVAGEENFPMVFQQRDRDYDRDNVFENNEICFIGDLATYRAPYNSIQLVHQTGSETDWTPACLATNTGSSSRWTLCVPEITSRLICRNNIAHDLAARDSTNGSTYIAFISLFPVTHGICEGNIVFDCPGASFILSDTGRNNDVVIKNNVALDIIGGVSLTQSEYGGVYRNYSILNNYFTYRGVNTNAAYHFAGVDLRVSTQTYDNATYKYHFPDLNPVFSNIVIEGNRFVYGSPAVSGDKAVGVECRFQSFPSILVDSSYGHTHLATNSQYENIIVRNNVIQDDDTYTLNYGIASTGATHYSEVSVEMRTGAGFKTSNNRRLGEGIAVLEDPYVGKYLSRDYTMYSQIPVTISTLTAGNVRVTGNLSANAINGHVTRFNNKSVYSVLPLDGGFGDIYNWTQGVVAAGVGLGTYEKTTNEFFGGRSSMKITATNTVVASGSASARFNGRIPTLLWGDYVTMGAFFKTYETGVCAYVSHWNADSTYEVDSPKTLLPTNEWKLISISFPVTNNLLYDFRVGANVGTNQEVNGPMSPPGSVLYVDNAFIARGFLASNEFPTVSEVFFYPTATNCNPLFIGEEVYDTTISAWYKAKGFTTNDWVKLN